jgi:tetratricopeptide (TPR) repeat protein
MQRRHLLLGTAVLIILISSLMMIIPVSHVYASIAHSAIRLVTPTPTPDASTTLQMAQQEETNIQSILSIINILVVVYPILIAIAAALLGIFGFRGYRSLEKQGQDLVDTIKKLEQEAEEKKAAIERTQNAIVYLALGDRLSNQKDMRKAIEAYKKAGSLLPDDPQINYVLGRIYSGAGYYEEAIQSFQAAIAAQPRYPEAEMELGLAYRRQGEYQQGPNVQTMRESDYEKAKEHLQKAIELQPDYEDALSTLGGLYRREGDYERAFEYYRKAYQANHDSSYALGNVASLAWYLGRIDEARKYYERTELVSSMRTMDGHSEIYWDYYDLALAQLVLGKTEEAKKNYQKAIGDTPGVVQFDSVLNVLKFLQNAKEPIAGLKEVIQTIEKEKATRISLG